MFIIVFVDEENASRAISKSVEFVCSRPVEIVALAIVAIVARLVLFFIPILSISPGDRSCRRVSCVGYLRILQGH